jgi:hypothetical protein
LRCDIATPMFLGGVLACFAFYRHTLDAQHSFLMLVAPGAAALASLPLDAAAPWLARLRGGIAPLVLIASSIAILCSLRFNELRREFRARPDDPGASARELPPPDLAGREIAALIPSGSFVLVPSRLGLNLAASFYAWRSLWPVENAQDTFPFAVAKSFGLGRAPHYLALPYSAPESARSQIDALRKELVHDASPTLSNEHWAVWLLH